MQHYPFLSLVTFVLKPLCSYNAATTTLCFAGTPVIPVRDIALPVKDIVKHHQQQITS